MQELNKRHTTVNLADSLQNVATEWQIDNKIVSIVHDNACITYIAVQ